MKSSNQLLLKVMLKVIAMPPRSDNIAVATAQRVL